MCPWQVANVRSEKVTDTLKGCAQGVCVCVYPEGVCTGCVCVYPEGVCTGGLCMCVCACMRACACALYGLVRTGKWLEVLR